MDTQEKYVDQADLCELAHIYTVEECKALNIKVDEIDENGEEDGEYTEEAQKIFDKHYKLITETLSV
jgi:hypothetical protein